MKQILRIISVFTLIFITTASLNIANAAPKIQHWETSGGLRVYFVPAPELDMLDLELVFAAGSARNGDKPGVAMLTGSILNKGAAGMNADQIAEAFESVGAQFSSSASTDRSTVGLRTVTMAEEQQKALDMWLKVISKPEFPEKDFQRSIKQTLIGLEAKKQDPGSIADEAFSKHVFGDHPYGVPGSGTEESIKAMKINDLKTFYKKHYVSKNGLLAMVGNIDRKQAEAIAEKVSTSLQAGEKAAPIPEVKQLTEGKTIRIEFPSAQSHIYMGHPGNKRGDKDYFSLYLGNHVFGGSGFTSRLMKEVRVKRGLSYSVYSYFMPLRELGPYTLGLQTKNESVDEALKVSREELNKFLKDGPTDAELEQSKKNITGGFPLRTASNSDIVSYISMIGFYGMPLDYMDTFAEKISMITREEVMDAFKRRLHPDKMITVIVGKSAEKKTAPAKEVSTDGKEKEAAKAQ